MTAAGATPLTRVRISKESSETGSRDATAAEVLRSTTAWGRYGEGLRWEWTQRSRKDWR